MNNPTQLLPTDLIAVEVPKDANYTTHNNRLEFISQEKGIGCIFLSQTTKDKFRSLGEVTADSISFDVEDYIDYDVIADLMPVFRNYITKDLDIFNLSEEQSFRSLLQSNGLYFVNLIEKPKKYVPISSNPTEELRINAEECYSNDLAEWQESERKVIKGKLVILKKL